MIPAKSKRRLPMVSLVWLILLSLSVGSCSVNPATGQRELALISEQQEIAIGRQGHEAILQQFGVVPDDELQRYVDDIGQRLAAVSERPDLPWTFTVLDDPLVNAFAAPGGFIYITRGILAHMNSEAELVGVLGHEIGHVTARHAVSQMSKGLLGQLALGIGTVAAGEYGGLVQDVGGLGLGLLSLKYSRDDERQSDSLGVRYAQRTGYDVDEIPGVYEMLGRVSAAAGQSPVPNWLATHPAPENRTERLQQEIATLGSTDGIVDREEYLRTIEGMIYGVDPRQGYFRGQTFYHPDLAFALDFPDGAMTENTRQAVIGVNQSRDAVVLLTLETEARSVLDAEDRFFQRNQGAEAGPTWREEINGLTAASRGFTVYDPRGTDLRGVVAFVEHRGRIFRLLGYTTLQAFESRRGALLDSLGSFRPVRDSEVLNVQPRTLDLVRASRTAPFEDLPELRGRDLDELALVNNLDRDAVVAEGTLLKVIRGELPGER